jgi:hypothetical protein
MFHALKEIDYVTFLRPDDVFQKREFALKTGLTNLIHNLMMTATLKVMPTLISNHFGKTYLL